MLLKNYLAHRSLGSGSSPPVDSKVPVGLSSVVPLGMDIPRLYNPKGSFFENFPENSPSPKAKFFTTQSSRLVQKIVDGLCPFSQKPAVLLPEF